MSTSAISTAVGSDRRARVSGYKKRKGFFSNETNNLPQIIALFGEANTANQTGLTVTKRQITSEKEAAEYYGYGSPIHQQARIFLPTNGGEGIGGIPVFVFPQITAGGAAAATRTWTVTGTASGNATHSLVINGRDNLDLQNYAFSVASGDTPTVIAAKIADAVSAVLGAPVTAVATTGSVLFTTKWKGATASELNIVIDFGNDAAGVSYSQSATTSGSGVVDLSASLAQFGDDWYTCLTNPYGSAQLAVLEAFNGIPDPDQPTGRYAGLIFKPFMAFFGSTLSDKDDLIAITDAAARVSQCTNVLCAAPNSKGFSWEAAANAVTVFARVAQDTPHLDVNARSYPDMPIPADFNIGDMADYTNRDLLVKNGCSTVTLQNGFYKFEDFVTTYHPEGESPLQYAYCRNINVDNNWADGYRTLERIKLKDKVLVQDNQVVDVTGTIKPSEWKGLVFEYIDFTATIALIKNPEFSKAGTEVQISSQNTDRFETVVPYKRTGIARIVSTDVIAGF